MGLQIVLALLLSQELRQEIETLKMKLQVERLHRKQAEAQAVMLSKELDVVKAQNDFKNGVIALRDACVAKSDADTDRLLELDTLECVSRPKPKEQRKIDTTLKEVR